MNQGGPIRPPPWYLSPEASEELVLNITFVTIFLRIILIGLNDQYYIFSRSYNGDLRVSGIGIIILGRFSVFTAIVVDEGSPVVVIQQGLHAKGGGDPKRGAKTCIAS